MSKNKKIILIILSIFIVLSLFLGISYAYYIKSINQEESNVVKTKCLNFSLTNEKNDINLGEQYPIPDTEGRKLTPYQFTITNTCKQFISYNVNLESLEATTMDSSAVKVMINNEAPVNLSTLESTSVSIDSSKDSKILATGSLGSNDSVDYTLRLWMDYGTTADTSSMNKVFESKIVVTATVGTYKPSDYVTTLHDAILVNEYGVTDVNNAISRIEAKGTPDLSQTAPIIMWKEIRTSAINLDVVKPSTKSINIDNQTSELTNDDTKMKLFSSYTFNSETGTYGVGDQLIVDPTTLDYENNAYYYSGESVSYNASTGKLRTYYSYGDRIIYKVVSCTKSVTTSIWNQVSYESYTYNLNVIPLSEEESESDSSDRGLYKSEDDYGDTYYYRGNVKNNNVYFAGYYWQIVRINGNGSIRLLYNGTKSNDTELYQSINSQKYKFNTSASSLSYSDYMYGNSNASNYDDLHSNINSSQVKNIVDDWYKSNISNDYSNYVDSSVGFCGDRSVYEGDGESTNVQTTYGAFGRFRNNSPVFKCPNISLDLYSIKNATIGSKSLDYPVGLISYDELVFAGLDRSHTNKLSWAYSSVGYWTMSPAFYYKDGLASHVWVTLPLGRLDDWGIVTDSYSVRPVINLKADVEISGGIGTINDPYVIKTS